MALPPSSAPENPASEPENLPNGVRAPPRMTEPALETPRVRFGALCARDVLSDLPRYPPVTRRVTPATSAHGEGELAEHVALVQFGERAGGVGQGVGGIDDWTNPGDVEER